MNFEQIQNATIGSMMTWGHMIWIFFPIPILCLILLSVPFSGIERQCTNLVGSIFFTRVSVGTVYIRLVWVSVGFSCLIFWIACRTLQRGFGSARVPCDGISCPFHTGETMWYRKASRYRAERNFWLGLFTLVLWLLVYKMYSLKETIVKLKAKMADSSNGQQKTEQDKKKD